ncbi:MAG: hypothetical protein KTR14_01895 [Vampirovibrio sp.]|nr:hypothetical protein [Vampirovibrio sp.]
MSQADNTSFEVIMSQIGKLPLWIKQVIFAQLRQELETTLAKSTLDAYGYDDNLQLFKPPLTHTGRKELEVPSGKCSPGLLKLLSVAGQDKSVINICITNNWTLEQCCIYLLEAMQKQYISTPASGIVESTIQYLANKIRLGEYLVKIGRLSVEQLDQALRTQSYIEDSLGERTGIANVLINLGYINKQDSEGILFLKEESKKSFSEAFKTLNHNLQGDNGSEGPSSQDYQKLQQQLRMAADKIRQLETLQRQK